MSNEEAIKVLGGLMPPVIRGDGKSTAHLITTLALSKAIEALKAEPRVRCKDCKNCGDNAGEPEPYFLYCFEWLSEVDENGYCYKGLKKDEVDNG